MNYTNYNTTFWRQNVGIHRFKFDVYNKNRPSRDYLGYDMDNPSVHKSISNKLFGVTYQNLQSTRNKINVVEVFLAEEDLGIIYVSETWCNDQEMQHLKDVNMHGGVFILLKEILFHTLWFKPQTMEQYFLSSCDFPKEVILYGLITSWI
ncbi:hypothetical protein HHI36_000724 [Cryptolaemus montrouzieri]|uniref:Uncharacterized protein n=1 Tax=Cryptolaemus montrouzieri TaxID=559131 RepID=A0ABD2P5D9_9CUCU